MPPSRLITVRRTLKGDLKLGIHMLFLMLIAHKSIPSSRFRWIAKPNTNGPVTFAKYNGNGNARGINSLIIKDHHQVLKDCMLPLDMDVWHDQINFEGAAIAITLALGKTKSSNVLLLSFACTSPSLLICFYGLK
jgi:hypothetical protein